MAAPGATALRAHTRLDPRDAVEALRHQGLRAERSQRVNRCGVTQLARSCQSRAGELHSSCDTPEARERVLFARKMDELRNVITCVHGIVTDTAIKKPLLQPALRGELQCILTEAPARPAGADAEGTASAAA
jgi:hypothetical protein